MGKLLLVYGLQKFVQIDVARFNLLNRVDQKDDHDL